ncbi:MAG: phytanoyl-CoA dioxygenase family protein [Planctomycetaceae bacterium]
MSAITASVLSASSAEPAVSDFPAAARLAAGGGFTADESEHFRREGYVVVRGLVDEALRGRMLASTHADLAAEVEPLEYEADLHYPGAPPSRASQGGRTVRRLKQAHSRHIAFTDWLLDPPLVNRLRQIVGPDYFCPLAHHNCIMTKQPAHSSDTGWHQDIRYWSFERPDLVSVWLALTPERPENGCLWLIPQTHRMEFSRDRLDADLFLRDDLPENQELITRKIPAELEPGDVLFFHCRTFHAATRNHTAATKYSVVFTFRPADNPPKPGTRSSESPELRIPTGM